MRASKYFASRMATSERVQTRLHEITRELSLQTVAGTDDNDENSLLSEGCPADAGNKKRPPRNQPQSPSRRRRRPSMSSTSSARTAHSTTSKRSVNSIQVVDLANILGSSSEAAAAAASKYRTSNKKKKSRHASTADDDDDGDDDQAIPMMTESSTSLLLQQSRPRLASTTSLRSLSSGHLSSISSSSSSKARRLSPTLSSSSSSAIIPNSSKTTTIMTAIMSRLRQALYLFPTVMSMLLMMLATLAALVQTLFFDAWTPFVFFGLIAVLVSGGVVIHYNQAFWRQHGAAASKGATLSARPQLIRRQSSMSRRSKQQRPSMNRLHSPESSASDASVKTSISFRSATIDTNIKTAQKKKAALPWKVWKWPAKLKAKES